MTRPTSLHRIRLLRCISVVAILLAGCSVLGGDDGGVVATASQTELVITNHASEDVYILVIGRQAAATANWAAGVEGDGLPPRGKARIPYEDIYRVEDEEEVIVYWWKAVIKNGERVHGEIHPIIVELGGQHTR